MQTECVRCHKSIDTVQGYKFSPNEYVCMDCYDEYKKERASRAKKQHKNPLIDQFGAEGAAAARRQTPLPVEPKPQPQPAPPAPPPRPEMWPEPDPGAVPPFEDRPQVPPPAQTPAPEQAPSSEELCDVCKKPVSDFKIPLTGGKKVCMDCNTILRDLAKSLILTVKCPSCGKEIQLAQD